jgi:hypothetical protein
MRNAMAEEAQVLPYHQSVIAQKISDQRPNAEPIVTRLSSINTMAANACLGAKDSNTC